MASRSKSSQLRCSPSTDLGARTIARMARWRKGEAVIERLLDQRHLEQVPADADTVNALLDSAHRHVASARALVGSDNEGAYALAYDAARKSATAILAHQ